MRTTFTELSPEAVHPDLDLFDILDVREAAEVAGPLGRIAGSRNVPLSQLPTAARGLVGTRPLLVVCRTGRRSARACVLLERAGALAVVNLRGGMIAWQRAELPLLRDEFETREQLCDALVAWVAQVSCATPREARGWIDALLLAAGSSPERPSAAALDHVLEEVAIRMREEGAPPDLEFTIESFRKDLVVL